MFATVGPTHGHLNRWTVSLYVPDSIGLDSMSLNSIGLYYNEDERLREGIRLENTPVVAL